jgi:hypothetical protein
MIQNVDGFPDNIVAFSATGQVTRQDYEQVLIPQVEAALKRHLKIRLYYEIGPGFAGFDVGAAWEDFKVGIEHLTRWDRAAIVTDVEWIRHIAGAFRFFFPGNLRVFSIDQAAEARTWISNSST